MRYIDELFKIRDEINELEKKVNRSPFTQLNEKLEGDPEYAWSFHCNIAMPILDSMNKYEVIKNPHKNANQYAADVMMHLFNIDITQFEEYKDIMKNDN